MRHVTESHLRSVHPRDRQSVLPCPTGTERFQRTRDWPLHGAATNHSSHVDSPGDPDVKTSDNYLGTSYWYYYTHAKQNISVLSTQLSNSALELLQHPHYQSLEHISNYHYYYNHFTAHWTESGTTWISWYQKGKTRKVKPIWIYWSKRQWVALAYLHLAPDR